MKPPAKSADGLAAMRDATARVYAAQVDAAQATLSRLNDRLDATTDPAERATLVGKLVRAQADLQGALDKQNDLIAKRLLKGT